MMENNNLLLYKLLCKDKVGGVGRGITVGKGRKESGMGGGGADRESVGANAMI